METWILVKKDDLADSSVLLFLYSVIGLFLISPKYTYLLKFTTST